MARLGYTLVSARGQLELVAHLSRWLAGEGLDAAALTPAVVEGFLAARRAAGYTQPAVAQGGGAAVGLPAGVGCRAADGEGCGDTGRAAAGALSQLSARRAGPGAETARGYVDLVGPFVAGRATADGVDLEHLRAGDVVGFVLASCRDRAARTAQLTVTALRSLLGFLHVDGLLATPLATAVPSVANRRAGLPRFLEPDQVEALLAHRLRHTAATSMLRAGAGLAEIGQVLRHRRPLTTAVYAKVDRDALRTLARPWPTGAA